MCTKNTKKSHFQQKIVPFRPIIPYEYVCGFVASYFIKGNAYVLEHCGLFYRSQLRIAVFTSFLFNRIARQEKNAELAKKKVMVENEPTG